jgi:hypothetical protein
MSESFELVCAKLLSSILRWGLLLTPEDISVPAEIFEDQSGRTIGQAGEKLNISQCRLCFTELPADNLVDHCRVFGPIALEFDQRTLIRAGAMPVFYIPGVDREIKDNEKFGLIGRTLIHRLTEIFQLLSDLADIHEVVSESSNQSGITISTPDFALSKVFDKCDLQFLLSRLTFGRQSPRELAHTVETLGKLFYPADIAGHSAPDLVYYREREWRIFAGPVLSTGSLTHRLSEDAISGISPLIDGTLTPYSNEPLIASEYLDRCELLKEIDGLPLSASIRRIVVPREICSKGLYSRLRLVASEFQCQDRVYLV